MPAEMSYAQPNIMINTIGLHRPKKVFESKEAIVFDDFLPEHTYEKIYNCAINADYERINTKGKSSRAWHVHDGFPLRSTWNYFYYADEATKPKVDYAYPTKTDMDIFAHHMLDIQPQVEPLIGKRGPEGWANFSMTSWIYPHGTGLSMHDDGAGIYAGAYAYFIHRNWRPHWGGLNVMVDETCNRKIYEYAKEIGEMNFYKGKWLHANRMDELLMEHGLAHCIFPKRNRIAFIGPNVYHMVTRVNEQAGDELRMSITGFFHKKN